MSEGRRITVARVLLVLAIAAHTPRLHAQVLSGSVRDSAHLQPVPGAVVLIVDSLGKTVGRTTTDQHGQYRISGSAGGRQIRVLRLGFRPQERPLAATVVSAPTNFAIVAIPLLLAPVSIIAARSCPSRADRPAALALLDQVRAGLLSTVIARSQNRATMTRLHFERRLDGSSDRILSQSVRIGAATVATQPFGAVHSAAAFVQRGFTDDSAGVTFFAPDAETLIDDGFLAGYCFHIMQGESSRPHQVGLGFAAATRRNGRIDITGALWVDTLARALRELEFRYEGLEGEISALKPGGRLYFRELSNGIALIDRWSLRLVSGRIETGGATLGSSGLVRGGRTSNLHIIETGGELARATWPDGDKWTAALGTVRVHAVNGHGAPAPGIVMQLVNTDYESTTDSTGTLQIAELLPGPYTAAILDPRLSELGIRINTSLRFVAERDSTIDTRLEVETAEDFVAKRCERDGLISGGAWILGRIVRPDGRPVADARWTIRDQYDSPLVENGRVGGDGLFHWCQLPLDKTVAIEAWLGERRVKATRVLTQKLTTFRLVLPTP